jgi:hypothetical protein
MARIRRSKRHASIAYRRFSRKIQRDIHKNAKATASRNWLPTDSQPEPHWISEWDGQIRASIAAIIAKFELDTIPVLQTIAKFNDVIEVKRPHPIERTPECRREYRRWEAYAELRRAAVDALVLYDQSQEALMRDIQAEIELNHSGRGIFYSKLSEYHPRPAEVRDLDETPLSMNSDFGLSPMAALERAELTVKTARDKLQQEGQPEAFNIDIDSPALGNSPTAESGEQREVDDRDQMPIGEAAAETVSQGGSTPPKRQRPDVIQPLTVDVETVDRPLSDRLDPPTPQRERLRAVDPH